MHLYGADAQDSHIVKNNILGKNMQVDNQIKEHQFSRGTSSFMEELKSKNESL